MNCEICESVTLPYKEKNNIMLYKCESCGFMQFDYSLFSDIVNVEGKVLRKVSKVHIRNVKRYRQYLINKNILDLGSGYMRYQMAMDFENIRYKTYTNVDLLCDNNIINADITKEDLVDIIPKIQYDVIIASHCLEHLQYPNTVINMWKRLLTDESYLYIEVPNCNDNSISDDWMVTYHLSYFNKTSLIKLMEKHFSIVDCDIDRNNIYVICKKQEEVV